LAAWCGMVRESASFTENMPRTCIVYGGRAAHSATRGVICKATHQTWNHNKLIMSM
jgi:hypothetical protein